jgi:hypothetical protein
MEKWKWIKSSIEHIVETENGNESNQADSKIKFETMMLRQVEADSQINFVVLASRSRTQD